MSYRFHHHRWSIKKQLIRMQIGAGAMRLGNDLRRRETLEDVHCEIGSIVSALVDLAAASVLCHQWPLRASHANVDELVAGIKLGFSAGRHKTLVSSRELFLILPAPLVSVLRPEYAPLLGAP